MTGVIAAFTQNLHTHKNPLPTDKAKSKNWKYTGIAKYQTVTTEYIQKFLCTWLDL